MAAVAVGVVHRCSSWVCERRVHVVRGLHYTLYHTVYGEDCELHALVVHELGWSVDGRHLQRQLLLVWSPNAQDGDGVMVVPFFGGYSLYPPGDGATVISLLS